MHPNSVVLVVLLVLLAAAALFLVRRTKRRIPGALAGLLAFVLAAVTGMAVVNDFYGYYQTWGQLSDDLTGSYTAFDTTPAHGHSGATDIGNGQLRSVKLAGATSHINRQGLVYLPPQYFQPKFAHTRFPVLEMIHGTPGTPSDWIVHLRLITLLQRLQQERLIGPMIVVMPTISTGNDYEECTNGPRGQDDTYVTDDVRTDVERSFRASTDPAQWGIGGYSSGGYCAANLALRHRSSFGAAGIMDGYFRPQDGPAAGALDHNAAAERANNPLVLAQELPKDVSPLPAFWISAGTSGLNAPYYVGATAFVKALAGIETVTLTTEKGQGHNFYSWSDALPHLLPWFWEQLSPPDLRRQFPISGTVNRGTIVAPVPLHPTTGTSSTPSTTAPSSAHASGSAHASTSPRASDSPSS